MKRPDNISDKDRKLAEELRSRLEGNQSSGNMNDPLLQSLIEFKESEVAEPSVDLSSSKVKSWNYIKQNINQSSTRKKTSFYRLGSFKHLGKIAAVITISVILSIYYFQIQTPQKPLAATESIIETVTLRDGSTVTLRPHSTLFENQISDQAHIYKLEGEAYFDVRKDKKRKFIVNTVNGSVEVLGTEFNLRTWNNSTDVYLKTGALRLSSTSNNEISVLLSPGEFSSLMTDQTISTPQHAEEKQFTSWRNSEIIFTNRRADSIFSELEHHYSISIVAPDSVNNEILGGSLSLENKKQSLENLGTVLGGSFIPSDNNTYEFIPSE